MTLQKIYEHYKVGDWPDKNSTHSYIPVYEEILKPYRHTAKNILEVGLMSGESLRMWNEYFSGDVYGIDCDIKPLGGKADLTEAIKEGYNIVIGDASNEKDIEKYFWNIKFDVVIEDAGHSIEQQLDIFRVLKPYMKAGGLYIVEDVQEIDKTKAVFNAIGGEVIDLRSVKHRYDDVLILIRF